MSLDMINIDDTSVRGVGVPGVRFAVLFPLRLSFHQEEGSEGDSEPKELC
jgi:hypothetical protein